MKISELIEFLQKCPQDAEVLTRTTIGTLVRPTTYGLVRIVPVVPGSKYDKRHPSRQLLPGGEWRIPINSKDEPETRRIYGFTL
jgi:hypothetical protein